MRFRTSIITAAAMLALVAPVAASATVTKLSQVVIGGGGTTANTSSTGSIVTLSTHKGRQHLLAAKNRPVVIVGAASPQALGACTTVMVEGYLLETDCGAVAAQSDIGSGVPSANRGAVIASSNSTSQEPATQVKGGCTTGLVDGYLLITYC
jgi:hypothetical protein